jgi:hypothetical protein
MHVPLIRNDPKEQYCKQFPLISMRLFIQLVQLVGEFVHVKHILLHFRQMLELYVTKYPERQPKIQEDPCRYFPLIQLMQKVAVSMQFRQSCAHLLQE